MIFVHDMFNEDQYEVPVEKDRALSAIMGIIEKVLHENLENGQPWFRGQLDKWRLTPPLYREKQGNPDFKLTNAAYKDLLNNFINAFRQEAPRVIKDIGPIDNDLQWEFLMQHYGIPSRFMDWSSDPLVALYFATHYGLKNEIDDICLYMIFPAIVNKESALFMLPQELDMKVLNKDMWWGNEKNLAEYSDECSNYLTKRFYSCFQYHDLSCLNHGAELKDDQRYFAFRLYMKKIVDGELSAIEKDTTLHEFFNHLVIQRHLSFLRWIIYLIE